MNIVFLSNTEDYPHQYSANNTKTVMLARGLAEQGCDTHIVGRVTGCKKISKPECGIDKWGNKYLLWPQKGNKVKLGVQNIVGEYKYLRKNKLSGQKNVIILDTGSLFFFLLHLLFGRLLGYKIGHIITEWPLSFKMSTLDRTLTNIYLLLFGKLVDFILPISDTLKSKVAHFRKPMLKTPILADYSKSVEKSDDTECYFSYCANAGYIRIIRFVLEAFAKVLSVFPSSKLVLVLYGRQNSVCEVESLVAELHISSSVVIKCGVSDSELYTLYVNAAALLIPLDPNSVQDRNRFSQKMAEYLSSKTPIITSSVGEVANYFVDRDNCFIADFTPVSYSKCMINVLQNKDLAKCIGERGYMLGLDCFNYQSFGKKLSDFIRNI